MSSIPLSAAAPLFGLRQPALELVDLGEQPLRLAPERDAVLGGLHGHPLLVRLRPSADPLRERLPDRSRQDERGTDDQRQTDHGDRGYPFSHATVSSLS